MRERLLGLGIDDLSAVEALYSTLESIYSRDYQIALTRDNSDLLIRVEGDAFENAPRLQLVTSIFENVSNQVTGLTKAILGLGAEGHITASSVDLGLSGLAKGSLLFGLKAQLPDPASQKGELLGETDSMFKSTKNALSIIDSVSHTVYKDRESVSMEAVSEVVPDPRVRDAALVAVQRISPSGRRGIESVSISGGASSNRPADLNSDNRRSIRESLFKPVIRGEEIELVGAVREIDLDSRRFDLRGIADEKLSDIRCAYRHVPDVNPKELIGSLVRVRGLVERAQDGAPRLMSVTALKIIKPTL